MSKVNSVKALRAERAKRLAQKRGLPPIKGSSYLRPRRTTLLYLHEILVKCWRESMVPQEMRDAKIITLYKNKGLRPQ